MVNFNVFFENPVGHTFSEADQREETYYCD